MSRSSLQGTQPPIFSSLALPGCVEEPAHLAYGPKHGWWRDQEAEGSLEEAPGERGEESRRGRRISPSVPRGRDGEGCSRGQGMAHSRGGRQTQSAMPGAQQVEEDVGHTEGESTRATRARLRIQGWLLIGAMVQQKLEDVWGRGPQWALQGVLGPRRL